MREREGGADGRMAGHRQFRAGREDAHAHVGARRLGRQQERALGEVHLARDGLHLRSRQPATIREDRQLVAFELAIRKDVVMQIPHEVILAV